MKILRKLICVMVVICIMLVNAGVMFADTGTPAAESAAGNEVLNEYSDETAAGLSYESGEANEGSDASETEENSIISADEDPDGYRNEDQDTEAVSVRSDDELDDETETDPDSELAVLSETEGSSGISDVSASDDPDTAEGSSSNTVDSEETVPESGGEDADGEAGADAAASSEEKDGSSETGADEAETKVKQKETLSAAMANAEQADDTDNDTDDGSSEDTFTISFDANGGSGTMADLTGVSPDTTDRIPVNSFMNSGEEGNYVRSWNTEADGSGDSYTPNSALSAVAVDLQEAGKTSVTLYAQWTASVTVNVRIQETHPSETAFGTQTGSDIYSRYNDGNYIQKSSDGGTVWTRTIAKVSTDDEYCTLPRVSAAAGMCLSRTGYANKNVTAYNTAKDGSGTFLRANQTSADQTNPVNTTTLNGGIPITEAGHTITIYVYWIPNTYSLTVHNNASSIGLESEEASVEYTGLEYGTKYYLNNGAYATENYTAYNWLLPSPKFSFDGYLFYGWNTEADGSGDWLSGFFPMFTGLSSDDGGSADLYALWKTPEGISEETTALSNGAVLTQGYSNFSDVDLMITKYFTGEGRQTDPGNIEFGVEGGDGQLYWEEVYSGGESSEEDEEETEDAGTGTGANLVYLTIALNKGTKQSYDLGDASAYVLLKDRAFDMEGNRYDVKITVSNINTADYSGKYDTGHLFVVRASGSCNLYSETDLSSVFDVDIDIVMPETAEENAGQIVTDKTTVLYFADMDIPANTASREFLGQSADDHNTYAYYDTGSGEVFSGAEHIEVDPADSVRICISDDNLIHSYVKDGMTQLVGTYYTGIQSQSAGLVDADGNGVTLSTEMTSAAILYQTGNIHFRFGATHASTALFMDDIFVNVVSNVRDRLDYNTILENGTGGFIDHGGEGAVSFARGSSPVYGIQALEGFYIKDVWVDGAKIVENGSVTETEGLSVVAEGMYPEEVQYAFENIQSDHTIDVSFERMLAPADLLLHKVCSDGERPADLSVMKDAEFSIEYFRGIYTDASDAENSGSAERSWVFKTDSSGELRMQDSSLKVSGDDLFCDDEGNVCLPEGTLVIVETKPPAGFEPNETEYLITLEYDNSGNVHITAYNEDGTAEDTKSFGIGEVADPDLAVKETVSLTNAITISKTVYKEDYLEEHGIPNFAFEIAGIDLTGKEYTFYRVLSFDGIAEGSGTVTKTVTLDALPSGNYVVRELDSFRYVLIDITSDLFSVEKEFTGTEADGLQEIDGYACGDLMGDEEAQVCFTDRKLRWNGYSDTSSAVNHLAKEHQ